jgi:hypothetical protein
MIIKMLTEIILSLVFFTKKVRKIMIIKKTNRQEMNILDSYIKDFLKLKNSKKLKKKIIIFFKKVNLFIF